MSIDNISFADYYVTPSFDEVGKFISGDASVCHFSTLEKFIEFFKYIFTGSYKPSEYQEIYNILHEEQHNTTIRPLLAMLGMMNMTVAEKQRNYSILLDETASEHGEKVAKFFYNDMLIAQTGLTDDIINQLKEAYFIAPQDPNRIIFLEPENPGFYISNSIDSLVLSDDDDVDADVIDCASIEEVVVSDDCRLSSESLTGNTTSASQPIDDFIKDLAEMDIAQINPGSKVGAGGYGTVYRIGEYVIKIMRNKYNNNVSTENNPESAPSRVSEKLNIANDDPNFSRTAQLKDNAKNIDVLVSKYINSSSKLSDQQREEAVQLLASRGLVMHDITRTGNVLLTESGEYYFVDGDQLALSQAARMERRPSTATIIMEEGLITGLQYRQYQNKLNGPGQQQLEYLQTLQATTPDETPNAA